MPSPDLPGRSQGFIPLETVGVKRSGRRPGERRLNLVRPAEPEQPKTLLQEMQEYITRRQILRDNGYFFLMGKEPENIRLADATHNDLEAIMHVSPLPDNSRDIMGKGNMGRIRRVFHAYVIDKLSLERQRDVLESEESIHEIDRRSTLTLRIGVITLTPSETETVNWLLARVGVPFNAPPEGFSESYSTLLLRMRAATAEQQPMWEQEQKTPEERYQVIRRG